MFKPVLLRVWFALTLFGTNVLAVSAQEEHGELCRDPRGYGVMEYVDYALQDVAIAGLDEQGLPVMLVNPREIGHLDPITQLFVRFHECAHHMMGHILRPRDRHRQELDADCWAIQQMAARGLLTQARLDALLRDISRLPPVTAVHLPGRVRARFIRRCLG